MKKISLALVVSCSILFVSNSNAAQYKVVVLPVAALGDNSYPSDINSVGEITVNLINKYSPAIDIALLDFDTIADFLTDLESAKVGDFSDEDYATVYSYIQANAENQLFQQITSQNGFIATESDSEQVYGFDSIDSLTDEYTNSAYVNLRAINDFGYAVGVSYDGFYKVDYINQDIDEITYVVNDFYVRGFAAIDGESVPLPPPETSAGGLSDAYDINNSNQIVGYGTTELVSDTFAQSIEDCSDEESRADVPQESCLRSLSIQLNASASSLVQRRGIIWQVDERGNVTDTFVLPMLITPDSSDTTIYSSTAVAINDFGIAVGQSPDYYLDSTSLTTSAAIYNDDQVTTINEDELVYSSTATDINNDNIVVGNASKAVNGSILNKFFVHDMDADLTEYPDDFYTEGNSYATGINNQNMVVGYGDSELTTSGTSRTGAFLYDYRNDIFNQINTLIECNSQYNIVEAHAINDDNVIVATATVTEAVRNLSGEIVYDEYGAETTTTHYVAVQLEPISGGSIDNCDALEADVLRQGGSVFWLLVIVPVGLLRLISRDKSRATDIVFFRH
ncbi:DUF3466 family protein [Aliiglaciecola lipolytica]|uniref:DUF3466 family protein n=1 Tax=Aliiglaciecola lipolytica E3 TaxID=1127673 RepID=K6Y9B2_9ALTE|nr:DUF3466 family protein [Aliiglaciecola lipolytica]GAC13263.1 hypothetical protein GLIP_0617 [Aliiglaciecola lipolytica E3]